MDVDNFLQRQRWAVESLMSGVEQPFLEESMYRDIQNVDLRYVFSGLHHEMNSLFSFMNEKFQGYGHYNADPSRKLLQTIEIYRDMEHFLKNTEYDFSIDPEYKKHLIMCEGFLSMSGGSEIPADYKKMTINKYDPVFKLLDSINISNRLTGSTQENLNMIGSGSYANVYKYKDTYYNRYFAVKRLKNNSRADEAQRFKDEFNTLNELHSPYILNVYTYDEDSEQYIMDLADYTLLGYLEKYPNLDINIRKSIAKQVLCGFKYLHSKGLLHRDIAYNNVLIFVYEDALVVKISDLGLVKKKQSDLTRTGTEIKGTLADPSLSEDGFKNYSMCHEIYALTRLIYFIMTNRKTLGRYSNDSIEEFVRNGTNLDRSARYKNDMEILAAFNNVSW